MFGTNSVKEYYRHLNLENKNVSFTQTTVETVLALLQNIDPSKAVRLDNLGARFLKRWCNGPFTSCCTTYKSLNQKPWLPGTT